MLLDCMLGLDNDKDCKSIAVYLHIKHDEDSMPANDTTYWLIGYVAVGGKTRWDSLDHRIGKLFTPSPGGRMTNNLFLYWMRSVTDIRTESGVLSTHGVNVKG